MATGVLPVFVWAGHPCGGVAENGRKRSMWPDCGWVHRHPGHHRPNPGDPSCDREPRRKAALAHFQGRSSRSPHVLRREINGQTLRAGPPGPGGGAQAPEITIYELELLDQTGPGTTASGAFVPKGTYIRTLCHDLGEIGLRRGHVQPAPHHGGLPSGGQAVTLEDVQVPGRTASCCHGPLFADSPAYECPLPAQEKRIRNGNPITDETCRTAATGSTAKRRFLCLSGHRAAFSPPSRISLEGDFVHERKSHCIGLL